MKLKLLICSIFLTYTVFSQNVIIGKVVDKNKKELAFVNVVVKDSEEGTNTDTKGNFKLLCSETAVEFEVSFLGFESKIVKISPKKKYYTITLDEVVTNLQEVVIVSPPKKSLGKKENPAYKILKEFWRRKHKMGVRQSDVYQYKKHNFTQVGLNNVDTIFIKDLFKSQYKEVMQEVQYDSDGINYYIPINMEEQVIRVYGNNKLKKKRVDIEAIRKMGLKADGFVFDKMSKTFSSFNVFDNNISLLRKSFVSPLSSNGFNTYNYLLYDSIVKNEKKLYQIYFFPKRKGDFAFQGNFWISEGSYSIKSLKMKVVKQSGLNFVRGLSVEKYFKMQDGLYLPTKSVYQGDFTLMDKGEDNKGIAIKKVEVFDSYIFNKQYSSSFYDNKIVNIRPNQFVKSQLYWETNRLNEVEKTYKLIKSIKAKKEIKKITGAINVFATGFVKLSSVPLQLGNLWSLLNYNSVEGLKLKLSFRTFQSKDDRYRLKGYLAHGFKDKQFKYAIESKYLLSYIPRVSIAAGYQDDVEQLGTVLLNSSGLLENTFGKPPLIIRGNNYFLSNVKRFKTNLDYAITSNFRFGLRLTKTNIRSAASRAKFSIDFIDNSGDVKSEVNDVASDFYICYTPNRNVYGCGVEQRIGDTPFTSLILNLRTGYQGFLGGEQDYQKLQFRYKQPIVLGLLGVTETTFDAGKIFGAVPISLLSVLPANQSYSIAENSFSLINYYDLITDEYLALHLEHHFNGFIFNRIPLLKNLKFRAVASLRGAYGTISQRNRLKNRSNITYSAPDSTPYYEYGLGIENIGFANFRMFRVDVLWRGDYVPSMSLISEPTPSFAIRLGMKVGI